MVHDTHPRESGATFVEFALVALIVFLMVLALIDTGRYLFYQVVLTRAAEQAVNWAKKDSRLTNDIRAISHPTAGSLNAYRAARDETAAIAVQFAATQFNSSASADGKKLRSMRMPEPASGWIPGADGIDRDAALIMPGQTVQVVTGNGATQNIDHPTCAVAAGCTQVETPGTGGWEKLLIDHPLIVQIRGQLPLYLLLNQAQLEIVGQAAAWQERVPIGTSPAPNVTPTATLSVVPTPTPGPTLCSALGEAAACTGKCTQPWERCVFQPNNMTPDCAACVQQRCSEWSSPSNWCINNGSCAEYQTCSYNAYGTGNACEVCTAKLCLQWKTEEQFCATLDCQSPDNTRYCSYTGVAPAPYCGSCATKLCYAWTNEAAFCASLDCASPDNTLVCSYTSVAPAPYCGSCRRKLCSEWTNEAAFCASLNCVSPDNTLVCSYTAVAPAPYCGSCRSKLCSEWTNEAEFCASLNCVSPDDTLVCSYTAVAPAPYCGSCRSKLCSDWTNEAEFCASLNCQSPDNSQTCVYSPSAPAPYCGSCRSKLCSEWTNEAEFCASLNCQSPDNTRICVYSPSAPAPYCGSCGTARCIDWITMHQWCTEHGCIQPWQTCDFYPNSPAPNCGTGACSDALCSDWTNETTACAGVTCPDGYGCQFLPGNTGQNCTRCQQQICSQVTTESAACAAIGCDLNYNTCTWDPNSNDIPTCGATCTPKPCSELALSMVCYAGRCSAYQNCSLNMSGTPPNNCYTCTPILCSAWTTQSTICSQCAPGQTCQWLPNNAAPNCGSCADACVGTCKPGEIWDPVNCRCVGSS